MVVSKRCYIRTRPMVGMLGVCYLSVSLAQDPPPPPPPVEEGMDSSQIPPPPPPPPTDDVDNGGNSSSVSSPDIGSSGSTSGGSSGGATPANTTKKPPGKRVPPAQDLVSIDFPDGVAIKDVIKAVSQWTGKNFILGQGVSSTAKVTIISPQQVTREEAYQAFLSALNIAGFTTVDTGKAVKIVSTRSASSSNIKTFYGSSWAPMTDEIITQIIPLQYIDANTIAQQLRTILRESNPVPFSSTNSLIVSDTGHKVRRLLEIILLLDVKSNQPQVSILPIKHTDAKDIKQKIEEIFGSGGGKGSSLYLQKSIVDERTNSLILIGPPRGLDDVARFIARVDKPLEDAASMNQIHVRALNYADAEKLAATLQALAQGSSAARPAGTAPRRPGAPNGAGGTTVAADLGGVKITAEKTTNSLIIQGSRSAFKELDAIINQLDRRKFQVYVESDIIDVNLSNSFLVNTTVLAGVPDKALGGRFNAPFGWKPGEIAPFAVKLDGATNAEKAQLVKSIPSMAVLGILSQKSINIGGIEISPGAFIFALKEDGNSNVLQSPSLVVNDNEEANFDVTERETLIVPTEDPTTKLKSFKTENIDATLGLKIKPQISKAHEINMDLQLKAESFGRRNSDGLPVQTNKRAFNTKISVRDHQTVVISGLQRDIDIEGRSKVPLLGDIPVLGWLFRNSSSQKQKTNLMIFLTPHVVRDADDMSKIYERKVKDQEEFLKKFYGKDFKEKEVFRRMPSVQQGKVPPLPAGELSTHSGGSGSSATGLNGASMDSKEGNIEKGNLPSEDPNPIVVPGGARSGGGAPAFSSAPEVPSPAESVPPPPPPPLENNP